MVRIFTLILFASAALAIHAADGDAANAKKLQQLAVDPDWKAGVESLREMTRKEDEATRAASQREAAPSLELVESAAVAKVFPEIRFFRIVSHDKYYKPGQTWHGTLYALKKKSAAPEQIYRVGQSAVNGDPVIKLARESGLTIMTDAQAKDFFVAIWNLYLYQESDLKVTSMSKETDGWKFEVENFATQLLKVDADKKPAALTTQ